MFNNNFYKILISTWAKTQNVTRGGQKCPKSVTYYLNGPIWFVTERIFHSISFYKTYFFRFNSHCSEADGVVSTPLQVQMGFTSFALLAQNCPPSLSCVCDKLNTFYAHAHIHRQTHTLIHTSLLLGQHKASIEISFPSNSLVSMNTCVSSCCFAPIDIQLLNRIRPEIHAMMHCHVVSWRETLISQENSNNALILAEILWPSSLELTFNCNKLVVFLIYRLIFIYMLMILHARFVHMYIS
jgi:hypothetical protein